MHYLIDLDGTIYCGRNPLPHAADFIGFLNQRQIPYRFLTNAPENYPEDIERRLVEMGVQENDTIRIGEFEFDYVF